MSARKGKTSITREILGDRMKDLGNRIVHVDACDSRDIPEHVRQEYEDRTARSKQADPFDPLLKHISEMREEMSLLNDHGFITDCLAHTNNALDAALLDMAWMIENRWRQDSE